MTRLSNALIFAALLCSSSCADEELHISCPFDNKIAAACVADGGEKITCLVETHPQCPEDICIAWKGTDAVCSRPCTPGAGECPDDSFCARYDLVAGKHYCVPDELEKL